MRSLVAGAELPGSCHLRDRQERLKWHDSRGRPPAGAHCRNLLGVVHAVAGAVILSDVLLVADAPVGPEQLRMIEGRLLLSCALVGEGLEEGTQRIHLRRRES